MTLLGTVFMLPMYDVYLDSITLTGMTYTNLPIIPGIKNMGAKARKVVSTVVSTGLNTR